MHCSVLRAADICRSGASGSPTDFRASSQCSMAGQCCPLCTSAKNTDLRVWWWWWRPSSSSSSWSSGWCGLHLAPWCSETVWRRSTSRDRTTALWHRVASYRQQRGVIAYTSGVLGLNPLKFGVWGQPPEFWVFGANPEWRVIAYICGTLSGVLGLSLKICVFLHFECLGLTPYGEWLHTCAAHIWDLGANPLKFGVWGQPPELWVFGANPKWRVIAYICGTFEVWGLTLKICVFGANLLNFECLGLTPNGEWFPTLTAFIRGIGLTP